MPKCIQAMITNCNVGCDLCSVSMQMGREDINSHFYDGQLARSVWFLILW